MLGFQKAAVALLLGTAIVGRYAQASDMDQCAAILQPALKTLITIGKLESSSDSFTAWQCSQSFSTHQDAMNAGLSVGVVVYGVPLQVGGTFDQSHENAWKSQNCSESSRATSSDAATSYLLSELAPGVAAAWTSCIHAKFDDAAVECDIAGNPAIFTAKWRRTAGESSSEIPVTTRWSVVNGTCDSSLTPGDPIGDGGQGISCTPFKGKALAVLLNTTKGFCGASLNAVEDITRISGTVTLQGDKTYTGDVIEFEPGTELVTNGHYLAISANELRLDGDSRVVSFQGARPDRPAGDPGRSGGTIIIQVQQVTGDRLAIDASGEDGATGSTGATGATGIPGTPGRRGAFNLLKGCVGRVVAGKGGIGGPGGPGGQGGAAGNGGEVIVRVGSGLMNGAIARIAVVNTPDGKPQPGAPGGPGGRGPQGPGGPGGSASAGSHECGGVGGGPLGDPGPFGAPGTVGPSGSEGSALFEASTAGGG